MAQSDMLSQCAPPFESDVYTDEERKRLNPFFTNIDKSVYVPLIISPELIGALCSRTSRAVDDLRKIYLREFIDPFLHPVRDEKESDSEWSQRHMFSESLRAFISFLQTHSFLDIFSNPRARSFYVRWLAQYGDDSIAQMAGLHLVFTGISQVAIKHLEDQRIGLAPLEKSTRYVDYSKKIGGHYAYYRDPLLSEFGLMDEYVRVMDGLFETYASLVPKYIAWLTKKFPEEKPSVVEKKAFDTLRGLLPTSTLSQVAFFGNGQAFEYLIQRCARHPLGELRWVAKRSYEELVQVVPSFVRRIKDEERKEVVEQYQHYLAQKSDRVSRFAPQKTSHIRETESVVELVEYDAQGEEKVIAGILYVATGNTYSWNETYDTVRRMSDDEKRSVLNAYCSGRNARWQKVGRAFENTYVRFDILMNIGAWRDLHRHRMHTQQRQMFSCGHGYDIPTELIEPGLDREFADAIKRTEDVYEKIAAKDIHCAQYCVTLTHRIRFMQWQNLRECFWEMELRTIPEGHPDYRRIEQQKFALLKRAYPLIAEHMLVNIGDYDFARRGQEEKIQKKLERIQEA